MKRFAFLVVVALAAAGCPPPPNSLDGSIKQSHDLTFDRVEFRYFTDQLAYELDYFRLLEEGGTESDTVAKVVFNEPEGGVVVEQAIDLLAPEIEGQVERITAKDDPFPTELEKASVTFLSDAVVGDTVKGEFAVTFANGKTLNGAFETELAEASF